MDHADRKKTFMKYLLQEKNNIKSNFWAVKILTYILVPFQDENSLKFTAKIAYIFQETTPITFFICPPLATLKIAVLYAQSYKILLRSVTM